MQRWQHSFLGIGQIPTDLSPFEIRWFFTLKDTELATVRHRHRPLHQLAIALQVGFLRLSGRLLGGVRLIPSAVLDHLGAQLQLDVVPTVASIRSLYKRKRTLHEHQAVAAQLLGFSKLPEKAQPWLARHLRMEATALLTVEELVFSARLWIYDHHYLVPKDRYLLDLARDNQARSENELLTQVETEIPGSIRAKWFEAIFKPHSATPNSTVLEWLQEAPKKHSPGNFTETLEKVRRLRDLGVHECGLTYIPIERLRTYAQGMIRRRPVRFAQLKEPRRTLELVSFVRYSLLRTTDDLLQQFERRVADLWRAAHTATIKSEVRTAAEYRAVIHEILALLDDRALPAEYFRERIRNVVTPLRERPHQSRTQIIRQHLMQNAFRVHALMSQMVALPFEAAPDHPLLAALDSLRAIYASKATELPLDVHCPFAPRWAPFVDSLDRHSARHAFAAATMLYLKRSLRNGSVWLSHSLSYRSRDALLIPQSLWDKDRERFYRRLGIPLSYKDYLKPHLAMLEVALEALSEAVNAGEITIEGDKLHVRAITKLEDPSNFSVLRARLLSQLNPIQLPELIVDVDSQCHFSWQLLHRPPKSEAELLTLYAAIIAHGMNLDATDLDRMIPGLQLDDVRRHMLLLEEPKRLRRANTTVLEFMRRHPIVRQWGVEGLASGDMMSLDAGKRLWTARADPRRRTHAVGTYTHKLDQWGIAYDQHVVLLKRQAGPALEGALRQTVVALERLTVDSHGHTHIGMTLAKLVGFDLCPRVAALDERKLFVPRGVKIPDNLRSIVVPLSLKPMEHGWDGLVRLAASIQGGWCSAVLGLERFGSETKGDPIHKAGTCLGKLFRTVFFGDYLPNPSFRRELHRSLNIGESVHDLQRTICPTMIAPKRARRSEEHAAISGALALLTNLVMAWNTHQIQAAYDSLTVDERSALQGILSRISPASYRHINFKGIFQFPLQRYLSKLLVDTAPITRHTTSQRAR